MHYDRFPAFAADLVRRQVAMIFAPADAAALAAKAATTTVPIVFTTGLDPVDEGLVASLHHPGANITGVSMRGEELIGKRMELLHEIVRAAVTVGYLLNPIGGYPEAQMKDVETAARALGVQFAIFNANTASQIETAFATLVERRIGALTIGTSAFFSFQREQLVSLAAHHGIPVIYWRREFVDAGGLISYGPNGAGVYRLAGTYAGRILKGEKPADMPVQRSPRIEMVLNLKAAKALGIEIPPRVAVLADQVIE